MCGVSLTRGNGGRSARTKWGCDQESGGDYVRSCCLCSLQALQDQLRCSSVFAAASDWQSVLSHQHVYQGCHSKGKPTETGVAA